MGTVAPGWPEPMTPPKSSKPFSQGSGQRAAHPYLGPCCPPAWLELPPAQRAREAGVAGVGKSADTSPLFLCLAP